MNKSKPEGRTWTDDVFGCFSLLNHLYTRLQIIISTGVLLNEQLAAIKIIDSETNSH